MTCPRCQHENRATARFCEECAGPLKTASAVTRSHTDDLKAEVESLRQALTESFARQTATSEILRVISSSPTDVQPVFDAIVRSTGRLCRGVWSALYQSDGTMLHLVGVDAGAPEARANPEAFETWRRSFPIPVDDRSSITSHAIGERRIVSIGDIEAHPDIPPRLREASRSFGFRSCLFVPLLRGDAAIGAIGVTRRDPEPFTEREIELLKTFAEQAVIAIENVRLFKELEAANRDLKAASQHKSEFLANMSHELRTPLNAIIGFSEVLSERLFGDLNTKQDEYLKDIHASGQHLLSLINDILDLSKIEAGRMELELAEFHLPQAIENALVLVRERALRRGITLEQSIDSRLGEIPGDERKIKQVLLNLLSNAIKFTPEGGRIEVHAKPVNGSVEVSVTDTGVGIAPEDQEAIFEEFRQVGTADKMVEGTGLGLALSRKFIELHGGRIWVESQVGAGSTFTFTLPVHRGE